MSTRPRGAECTGPKLRDLGMPLPVWVTGVMVTLSPRPHVHRLPPWRSDLMALSWCTVSRRSSGWTLSRQHNPATAGHGRCRRRQMAGRTHTCPLSAAGTCAMRRHAVCGNGRGRSGVDRQRRFLSLVSRNKCTNVYSYCRTTAVAV